MNVTGTPSGSTDPTDTPLSDVLGVLGSRGYTGQFVAEDAGTIRCITCRTVFAANGARPGEMTRLEGASDPDDEILVIPIVCPSCHTKGSLTLGYGPAGHATDQDAIVALGPTWQDALATDPAASERSGSGPTPGITQG